MWMSLLKYAVTYLIDLLLGKLWSAYEKDQETKEEDKISKEVIRKKVKALKDAKTPKEIRNALNDLSI